MPIQYINNQPIDFRVTLPSDSECKDTGPCGGSGDTCIPYNKLDNIIFQLKQEQCDSSNFFCSGDLANNNTELVTNGAFTTNSNWTFGTGWTYDGTNQSASLLASGTGTLYQSISISSGNSYVVKFSLTSTTGTGSVTVTLGGTSIGSFTATGDYEFTVVAGSANTRINFTGSGAVVSPRTILVDNVSVKSVLVGNNDTFCLYSSSPENWIQERDNTLTHTQGTTDSLFTEVVPPAYTGYYRFDLTIEGYVSGSADVKCTPYPYGSYTIETLGTITGNGTYSFYYYFNSIQTARLYFEISPTVDFEATITSWSANDMTLYTPIGLVNQDNGYAVTLNEYITYDREYLTINYPIPANFRLGVYKICIYDNCGPVKYNDLIADFDFNSCDWDSTSPDTCAFGTMTIIANNSTDNTSWIRPVWDSSFTTFEAGVFNFYIETGDVNYANTSIELYNLATGDTICHLVDLVQTTSPMTYQGFVNIVRDQSYWDPVVRIVVATTSGPFSGTIMELYSFQLTMTADYPSDIPKKVCSNCLDIATSHRCTQWIAGDCDQQAFGFSFAGGFQIAGRVRSMFINPKYKGELQRYADNNGRFTVTRASSNKIYTFLIDYVPERTHDWLRLALLCDEINIGSSPSSVSLWVNTEGDYQPEWPDSLGNFQFAQARVELQAKTDELYNNNAG